MDVLLVINHLNSLPQGSGEGEGFAGERVALSAVDPAAPVQAPGASAISVSRFDGNLLDGIWKIWGKNAKLGRRSPNRR
jgi:hypothetical protein